MNNQLHPCFWFNGDARPAADFYCSVFPGSKITVDTPLVVNWELYGQKFMGLNGGPLFRPNPSISLFITCENEAEADAIWTRLSEEARVLMPLGKYAWSDYYGFLQDRFGIAWQIFKGDLSEVNQKICPCFLFTDSRFGRAREAVQFYSSVFKQAGIDGMSFYDKSEMQAEGIVKHSQFRLDGNVFMAMDGPGTHHFTFNEGVSFLIQCQNQAEIDYYWEKFTSAGEESRCGWCKDQFGVSWQIVPAILGELMRDPEKSPRVMQAFLKMKKFDIETLLNA